MVWSVAKILPVLEPPPVLQESIPEKKGFVLGPPIGYCYRCLLLLWFSRLGLSLARGLSFEELIFCLEKRNVWSALVYSYVHFHFFIHNISIWITITFLLHYASIFIVELFTINSDRINERRKRLQESFWHYDAFPLTHKCCTSSLIDCSCRLLLPWSHLCQFEEERVRLTWHNS